MKRTSKILILCLAGIVSLSIAAIITLRLFNGNTQTVILEGPAMSPAVQAGQELKYTPYTGENEPQRGDIVLYMKGNGVSENKNLIHRIVGIPEDIVTISNGRVLIYNSQYPEGYNPDSAYLDEGITTQGEREVVLSSQEYFVLGDNRHDSLDSRVFGPIKATDIIGRIELSQ